MYWLCRNLDWPIGILDERGEGGVYNPHIFFRKNKKNSVSFLN